MPDVDCERTLLVALDSERLEAHGQVAVVVGIEIGVEGRLGYGVAVLHRIVRSGLLEGGGGVGEQVVVLGEVPAVARVPVRTQASVCLGHEGGDGRVEGLGIQYVDDAIVIEVLQAGVYVGQRSRVGGEVERRSGVEPDVVGTELSSVGSLVVQPMPGVLQPELVGEVAGVAEVVHQQNCASISDEGLDS